MEGFKESMESAKQLFPSVKKRYTLVKCDMYRPSCSSEGFSYAI